jgi:hypothetical protein
MTLQKLTLFFAAIFSPCGAIAWDGYDYDAGTYIEVESGELVRDGEEIEYYDYGRGEYRRGEVQDIQGLGEGAEVEVYDYDSGEYRTFEMD